MMFGRLVDGIIKPSAENAVTGVSMTVLDVGLRVNHYAIKSRLEFDKKKKFRGDAMFDPNRVKGDRYFSRFDRNDVVIDFPTSHYLRFKEVYDDLLIKLER